MYVQTPMSSFAITTGFLVQSPSTFTSLALGARNRKVTLRSAPTTGETNCAETRCGEAATANVQHAKSARVARGREREGMSHLGRRVSGAVQGSFFPLG